MDAIGERYGIRPSAYFNISLEEEGDLALAFDTTVRLRGQRYRDDQMHRERGTLRPKGREEIQVQKIAQANAFEEIRAKLDKVRAMKGTENA